MKHAIQIVLRPENTKYCNLTTIDIELRIHRQK